MHRLKNDIGNIYFIRGVIYMKILLVGATGTIGQIVYEELKADAEIIQASRHAPDYPVDITSQDSIKQLFNQVCPLDGIICTVGAAHFGPLEEMTPEQNLIAVHSKQLGQINMVLLGQKYLRDHGSITLTTGILMDDPLKTAASAAMANGAVSAFVKSAAIEIPRGIRINHVSPSMLEKSKEKHGKLFQGYEPVSSTRIGLAYRKSVFGAQTGQAYKVY